MLNEKDEDSLPIFKHIIKHAINKVNSNSTGIKFNYEFEEYDGSSLFEVVNASCNLLTKDVVVVISPDISNNIATQADVFNSVKMPLIASAATDSYLQTAGRNQLYVMAPSDLTQAQVIVDLLTKFGWTKISLISSDSNYGIHSATTLQKLLIQKTADVTAQEEFDASVYFFEAFSDPADLYLEDILKNMVDSLDRVFVLHCEDYYARFVLQEAYNAGLLNEDFVWIVTESIVSSPKSLRVTTDMIRRLHFPIYYEGLIGISLYVDTVNPTYRDFKRDAVSSLAGEIKGSDITPQVVMLYDAAMLATEALQDNINELTGTVADARCGNNKWAAGEDIARYLTTTNYTGPSGSYNLDRNHANKHESQYRIVNFIDPGTGLDSGFSGIGTWTTAQGLKITSGDIQFLGGVKKSPTGIADTLEGQHLKVGTIHSPPFAINTNVEGCKEVQCWEGICPKIVKRLAKDLNFTYEFVEPEDKKYGLLNKTESNPEGEWDGLVGDLLKNRIDIIAIDLSVSSQRRSYIDFTFSYLDSGISLIMKGESKTDNRFFFFSPFAFSTWFAIFIAFALISVFQTILGKLSPCDQHGIIAFANETCCCKSCEDPTDDSAKCLVTEAQKETDFDTISLANAVWVIGGSLLGQGGEPLPRSPSGRMIVLTWWFFVLLITNMYGANLTAFMTLDNLGVPLSKPSELLTQTVYKWGVRHESITAVLLENNIDTNYQKLGSQSEFVSNFDSGLEMVDDGRFGLIDDTLILEYYLSDSCEVFFVGEKLLTIPVAFGLPINSPYARLFNQQLLKYREEGLFHDLWNEHGKRIEERKCGKDSVGSDKMLSFQTLIGIFYVLIIGVLVSVTLLILELTVATIRDNSHDGKSTFLETLKRRVKLAFVATSFQKKMKVKKRQAA
ncbi:glutamate receptor ionotropic, kainate 2-like [Bolinopsis microptera]|uniref:glutamate receptor ionotropic, kainate 2-like n=1 Tax=Bolinopsis microptera TaxID=2820187 RepID=UPI00307ADD14